MKNEDRKAAYLKQSGRRELTPKQRRRLAKKAHQGKN